MPETNAKPSNRPLDRLVRCATLGEIIDAFHANTKTRRLKGGGFAVFCKRGLWSVCGTDKTQVIREAMNYFEQYYQDGEYT